MGPKSWECVDPECFFEGCSRHDAGVEDVRDVRGLN